MSFEKLSSGEYIPVTYGYQDGEASDISPFDEGVRAWLAHTTYADTNGDTGHSPSQDEREELYTRNGEQ